MNKYNKGFTLIELIAVILILAIMAFIIVPLIFSAIEHSKKESARVSALNYIEAVNKQVILSEVEKIDIQMSPLFIYQISADLYNVNEYTNIYINDLVNIKGKKPSKGIIELEKNYELKEATLIFDKYTVYCTVENECKDIVTDNNESKYTRTGHVKRNLEMNFNYAFIKKHEDATIDLTENRVPATINEAVYDKNNFTFDGINDYIIMDEINSSNITYEVTFAAKYIKVGALHTLLANYEAGGCGIDIRSSKISGICYLKDKYVIINDKNIIEAGKIYKVALTYDNSVLKLYVNGELVSSSDNEDGIKYPVSNTKIAVGANPSSNKVTDSYFNGKVYATRIYSEALTEEEIKHNKIADTKLFNETDETFDYSNILEHKVDSSGLTSYYSINNNSGFGYKPGLNLIKDLSTNNIVGTNKSITYENNGLSFNGKDSSILLKELNTPNITYEVTFIPKYINITTQIIIGNVESGGCSIGMSNGTAYGQCYIDGAYITLRGIKTLDAGEIYNVSLTYDGAILKIYINGVLNASKENSGGLKYPISNTYMAIGANPKENKLTGMFFSGIIYSTRIYNRALNENEINSNYDIDNNLYNNSNLSFDYSDLLEHKVASPNRLQLYYSVKNNSGQGFNSALKILKDLSSSNVNVSTNNTTYENNALNFNGVNSYIVLKEINSPNITYEVSFNSKNVNLSSYEIIMANFEAGGCGIGITAGKLYGQCYLGSSYVAITAPDLLQLNQDYTASATYNGTDLSLYINGKLIKSITNNLGIVYPVNNTYMAIGANPTRMTVTGNYFSGNIYSAKIYDIALTPVQIEEHYNLEKQMYKMS